MLPTSTHLATNIASPAETPQARAALAYARRGWAVFPCVPRGKVPRLRDGFHGATCDLDTVARWWRAEPRANVALVPARCPVAHAGVPHDRAPASLLVLDLDGPLGAATAIALGVPSDGPAVTTGRTDGGEHRYFTVPAAVAGAPVRIGNRQLGPGVDVRHAHGYVLTPPSVHPSGAGYRWSRDAALAPLPPALLARFLAPTRSPASYPESAGPSAATADARSDRQRSPATTSDAGRCRRAAAYLERVPHGLSDGHGRNATAWRIAAKLLHDFALAPIDVASALAAWDAANRPPLGDAAQARILENARRYGASGATVR